MPRQKLHRFLIENRFRAVERGAGGLASGQKHAYPRRPRVFPRPEIYIGGDTCFYLRGYGHTCDFDMPTGRATKLLISAHSARSRKMSRGHARPEYLHVRGHARLRRAAARRAPRRGAWIFHVPAPRRRRAGAGPTVAALADGRRPVRAAAIDRVILPAARRPAMSAAPSLPPGDVGLSAPDIIDVVDAREVPRVLYSPYRDLLSARGALPPGDADAAAALAHWRDKRDYLEFRQWAGDPRRNIDRPQVNEDGFFECSEVRTLRDQWWLSTWRNETRAAAKVSGIYEPPPDFGVDEVPTDPDMLEGYGEECRAALAEKGMAPDKPETREVAIRRGRAAWGRWVRLARRMPPARVISGRSYGEIVPHRRYWELVADTRPIVISARTGRLIDGLRRLDAHLAAGRRSPGVHVVRRAYPDDAAEREAVIALNASNRAIGPLARVALAELLRPAYRRQAAKNSGRPGGEFTDLAGKLPTVGRRGARPKKRREGRAVRTNERLAAVAGMSRPTYEKYLRLLQVPEEACRAFGVPPGMPPAAVAGGIAAAAAAEGIAGLDA